MSDRDALDVAIDESVHELLEPFRGWRTAPLADVVDAEDE